MKHAFLPFTLKKSQWMNNKSFFVLKERRPPGILLFLFCFSNELTSSDSGMILSKLFSFSAPISLPFPSFIRLIMVSFVLKMNSNRNHAWNRYQHNKPAVHIDIQHELSVVEFVQTLKEKKEYQFNNGWWVVLSICQSICQVGDKSL